MFCDLHTVERSFVQPPLKLNSPGCLYTFVCCVVLLVPNGLYQKVLITFPGFNLKDASWDCASARMLMRDYFQLPNMMKMMWFWLRPHHDWLLAQQGWFWDKYSYGICCSLLENASGKFWSLDLPWGFRLHSLGPFLDENSYPFMVNLARFWCFLQAVTSSKVQLKLTAFDLAKESDTRIGEKRHELWVF